MVTLLAAVALASSPTTCSTVPFSEVWSIPPPAVIVLGERKGTQPDLLRAERVVRRLSRQSAVTLALEAVHHEQQPILDRYAQGAITPFDLPDLLRWREHWSFPWSSYERIVTSAVLGVNVVAVGLDPGPRPPEARFPVPPGYVHVLADAMGEHAMPVTLESSFVELVAWRDHTMAQRAVSAWDGEGYLVILADRLHVEGGKGIGWQVGRLTEAPVHSYLLASTGACYAGDKVLR